MKVTDALRYSKDPLSDLGFRAVQDGVGRLGGMSALNCRVNIYESGNGYELRVVLPNGNVVYCCEAELYGLTAGECTIPDGPI